MNTSRQRANQSKMSEILPIDPPRAVVEGGEEKRLVTRLRSGDAEAYEVMVRTYGGRLLAVARRLLHCEEDARDALQDAFLSAFRGIERFEGGCRLSTWLHQIVVNAALMKLRSRRRRGELAIEDLLPRFTEDGHRVESESDWDGSGVDRALQSLELRTLVRQSIDRLPDGYRTVLLLRDIEELDTAEAAQALGITENAVKVRLHRARQALRALIAPVLAEASTESRGELRP